MAKEGHRRVIQEMEASIHELIVSKLTIIMMMEIEEGEDDI